MPPDRFAVIQIMRGYLALCVMLGHSIEFITPPTTPPWGLLRYLLLMAFNPWAAVAIFFAISGFVLSHSVSKTPKFGPAEYALFLWRRLVRLAPVAWAGVALAILCSFWLSNIGGARVSTFYQSQGGHDFDPARLLQYFTLRDLTFDQALWSIVVEMSAAFVIPPLALFALRRRTNPAFHISIFSALIVLHAVLVQAGGLLFTYLFLFYAGIVAYSVHRRLGGLPPLIGIPVAAIGVAITGIGAWYFLIYGTAEWRITQYTLMAVGTGIFLSVAPSLPLPSWRSISLAVKFGDMSYSFYAYHIVVLYAVFTLTFDPVAAAGAGDSAMLFAGVAYGIAASALTLPVAYLSRRTLEQISAWPWRVRNAAPPRFRTHRVEGELRPGEKIP